MPHLANRYRGRWSFGIHFPGVPFHFTPGYQYFATTWLNPGVVNLGVLTRPDFSLQFLINNCF